MATWLKKASDKYEKRREEDRRVDMTYLTVQQREEHICYTWKQADSYIRRHLAKADAKKNDEKYVLVLDIE